MKARVLFLTELLALGVLLALSRSAFGADATTDFNTANKFYAEGKFADAASTYKKTIQENLASQSASPALYFNDGNAEFKLGHVGRAIAAYRHAALLAPRDSETLGNLEFVRNQVQGATVRPGKVQSLLGSLTLNEGSCLTAAALWFTFILLAVRQVRPALAPRLQGLTIAAGAATILTGAILAVAAISHFKSQTAVVIQANAIARSGPFEDAQNAFPVHDGAELSVLDHHDDWFQVADGAGKIGWLPGRQVEILPGA